MICIIALIVFGIMGIFSASHRVIAKEALDCVFRKVTLRKCTTGLDKRLKAQITGKLMKRHPKTGKTIYKHFELISWFFAILLLVSLTYSVIGIYNTIAYGNCNGEDSTAFCPFNPGGTGENGKTAFRDETSLNPTIVTIDDDPWLGNKEAKTTIIQFGCFKCKYTKKAALETVKKLYENNQDDILFVFRDFPLSEHDNAREPSLAAQCVFEQDQKAYWDYYFKLFENQEWLDTNLLRQLAIPLNINITQYDNCTESKKYDQEITKDYEDGFKAGIYGTPTFFINQEEAIVGPKSYRTFKKLIKK